MTLMSLTYRYCLLIISVISAIGLLYTGRALAADALQPHRTLLSTQRFTPSAAPPVVAGPAAHNMIAVRGEKESFQFVLKNRTGNELNLNARVIADNELKIAISQGLIKFEYLRVGHVKVPRRSKGMKSRAGLYADPLPPINSQAGKAGLLKVAPGRWGGIMLLATIDAGVSPQKYSGAIELYADNIVYARTPFRISVHDLKAKNGKTIPFLQAGRKGSFKTVFNVEADAYWLQHKDMRNGCDNPRFCEFSPADRMQQAAGLFSFLDSRGITPLSTPFGNPAQSGRYACSSSGATAVNYSFLEQLRLHYFARGQFPVRFLPNQTPGCLSGTNFKNGYSALSEAGKKNVKQDDRLHPGATKFFTNIVRQWNRSKLWGQQTYVKNPFDEPSANTPAMRRTMSVEVPKATRILKKTTKGKAKVVLADWPRDTKKTRICRSRSCATLSGDEYSNKKQWDGKGQDDPDVWMVPMSRLFGRSMPQSMIKYKFNRNREYANRLARIKRLKGGREVWAYNFYTADSRMPQLSIDAPGTDARLQYLLLAREGHTGLFVSNLMMGWASKPQRLSGNILRKGDPYQEALYYRHSRYGDAAGWGTFIYPGYRPELGLGGDARRNTNQAFPVSSLRLENMRDGQEDANLMTMYRQRFGEKKLQQKMRLIFPGRYRALTGNTLGNVVFPAYNNNARMAARMETARRQMINELSNH